MKNFLALRTSYVLIFLLVVSFHIKGQIVCTDVNPDLVSTGNSTVDIDLDNDATIDFRITGIYASVGPTTLSAVFFQANQVGLANSVLTSGTGSVLALPLNSVIGPSSTTWSLMNSTNPQMLQVVNGAGTGSWVGAIDQYVGLKLVVGSNTYYGWARFSFSSTNNTYTFKDYAYNSSPNQSILAGQGCGSLASPTFSLSNSYCLGNTTTLTANTGTATAATYSWISFPSAVFTNSNAATTSITFSSAGVYTVALIVTSGTIIGMGQNSTTINASPTVAITGNTAVCANTTLTLSVNSGTGSTYLWTGPNSYTSNLQNLTISNPQVQVSGTYSLLVTSGAGCSTNATTNVTVTAIPVPAITSNSPLCTGSTLSLSGSGGSSYSWTGPNSLSSTQQNISVSGVSNVNNGLYTLTVVDGPCTVSTTHSVSVLSLPSFTLSGNSPLCEGQTLNLNSTNVINATAYMWQGPSGFSNITQNVIIYTASTTQSGIYTLTITHANTCQGTSTLAVTVLQKPLISVVSSSPMICAGMSAVLTASGAASYAWSSTQITSSATVTPTTNTTYTVIGTAASNCTNVAMFTQSVTNCTGINESSYAQSKYKLFPNPAKDELFIQLQETGKLTIEITDALGNKIKELEMFSNEKTQVQGISLSGLSNGLYFVKINAREAEPVILKFIKE